MPSTGDTDRDNIKSVLKAQIELFAAEKWLFKPDVVSKICAESNVKNFIQVSAIGARADSTSIYQRSKFEGEKRSLSNFKNTIIVRPSVVCGTEDNFTNLFSKLSFMPIIPVVKINYQFQPVLVTDVAEAILKIILTKNNEGKIYELGGPEIITFGNMVKAILKTINKRRFVVEMPISLAKIQSKILSLLPFPPILTEDQCNILSESDNIVTEKYLSFKDLDIKPSNVEIAMQKWLWRFRDGGEFARKK